MIQAGVPDTLANWLEQFVSNEWMFLLLLNVFLLVVGMLVDIFSAIVVVVPLITDRFSTGSAVPPRDRVPPEPRIGYLRRRSA
jgi:hypothetical protein